MPNILHGTVTKAGAMAKTITVTITRRFEHPKYIKQMERSTKMLVHDELQEAKVGDRVSITHTRPLSSSKHFYLSAIDARQGQKGGIQVSGGAPALPPPRTMEQVRRRVEAEEVRRRKEESARPIARTVAAEKVGEQSEKPIGSVVLDALGLGSEGSKREEVSQG